MKTMFCKNATNCIKNQFNLIYVIILQAFTSYTFFILYQKEAVFAENVLPEPIKKDTIAKAKANEIELLIISAIAHPIQLP